MRAHLPRPMTHQGVILMKKVVVSSHGLYHPASSISCPLRFSLAETQELELLSVQRPLTAFLEALRTTLMCAEA